MTKARFFPLIDMDSDGTHKAAMNPTNSENTAKTAFTAYLEEIMPHRYMLHSKMPISNDAEIMCPYCGGILLCITRGNKSFIEALCRCPNCSEAANKNIGG